MDRTEHLLLVNAETKEEHQLQNAECVIGRGWLKVRIHFSDPITSNFRLQSKK